MALAVWIVSWVLVVGFGLGGLMHALVPGARLAGLGLSWAADVPPALLRAIGVAEVLGAIGLVAPLLTGILPVLAPLAACGLALVMLSAIGFHVRRREWRFIPVNVVLLALSVFVAVSRFAGV